MRDLLQLKVIRKGFFGKRWLQKTNEGYKWWQLGPTLYYKLVD